MDRRILTIGIDARLWNETGVGRYIRNLVKQLALVDKRNSYVLFLTKKEYKTVSLPGKNFTKKLADIHWHTLEEQLFFPSILYKENVDLMHFPYFSFPIFYSRPFVITIHDLILHHFSTGQASTLSPLIYTGKLLGYKFLLQNGAKRSENIITVSNATKREIIDHLHVPEEKITVTYEGIDNDLYVQSKKKPVLFTAVTEKYFLYVGNAYPHKNVEKLLAAFAKLHAHTSDVKLIFVGKKDFFYDRLIRTCSQLHLTEAVIFYHEIADAELAYLYKHAIALVIPSLMEGFGLPALEAMAEQCVVLASHIPSLEEICRDAAIYFDPNNIDDIAEKLLSVLVENPNRKSAIEKGFKHASQFSWERMAEQTVKVYESSVSL